jgi:hypothetical protein
VIEKFGIHLLKLDKALWTQEMMTTAAKTYGLILKDIDKKDQTQEMVDFAVKNNPMALPHVAEEFKTYDMIKQLVSKHPYQIKEFEQTDELVWVALKNSKSPKYVYEHHIKNKKPEFWDYVKNNDPNVMKKTPNLSLEKFRHVQKQAHNSIYFFNTFMGEGKSINNCMKATLLSDFSPKYYGPQINNKALALSSWILNPKCIKNLNDDCVAYVVSHPLYDCITNEIEMQKKIEENRQNGKSDIDKVDTFDPNIYDNDEDWVNIQYKNLFI